MNRLLTIVLLISALGCGSAPPAPSASSIRASEFNKEGGAAFERGDYKAALGFYSEALRLNRSIENFDGTAINLINISAVYRRLEDKDSAHKYLDEALAPDSAYQAVRRAEASLLKAALFIDEAKYNEASESAGRALSFCQESGCGFEGRIYNLKAKTSLLSKDPASGLSFAMQAHDLNKKSGDLEEEANSLRFIGDARLELKEYEAARKSYEAALSIDKAIGASRKIALDLIGMGNVFCRQERFNKDAAGYYHRALLVSESAGDKKGAAEAAQIIERCKRGQ